ncbi:hypothetical protein [Streptomyces sp. NPDC055681]
MPNPDHWTGGVVRDGLQRSVAHPTRAAAELRATGQDHVLQLSLTKDTFDHPRLRRRLFG